jgi:hypothetical protein
MQDTNQSFAQPWVKPHGTGATSHIPAINC